MSFNIGYNMNTYMGFNKKCENNDNYVISYNLRGNFKKATKRLFVDVYKSEEEYYMKVGVWSYLRYPSKLYYRFIIKSNFDNYVELFELLKPFFSNIIYNGGR